MSIFVIQIKRNYFIYLCFGYMVFDATFNNISDILRRLVVLMVETGVPGENYRPAYVTLDNRTICYVTLNVVIVS